jgi:hypothetical protein
LDAFVKETESFTEIYEKEEIGVNEVKKRETSTPLIAPRPMISQRKGANPFKKSTNAIHNTSSSSLNHLTKKSIGYSENVSQSDDENNLSKSNRSVSIDTPRPNNFSAWFIANQADIKANNPNVSESTELMRIGKAIYKGLTNKTSIEDNLGSNDSSASLPSLNKRKLDLNDENVGGASKLAKFNYTEN